MACPLAGFLEVGTDSGPEQVRHVPDFYVTHLLSSAFENSLRIRQFTAADETKVDVVLNYSDVANAVFHSVCRAIEERHDIHLQDVLAARCHFLKDQLSQRDRELLNSRVVWFQ